MGILAMPYSHGTGMWIKRSGSTKRPLADPGFAHRRQAHLYDRIGAARGGERQVASGRKASWNWNASTSLTALWLPIFRPHVFFLPPQADVTLDQNIPNSHRQWANKLDQSGEAIDWSVLNFDGFDKTSYGRQDKNRGVFALLRYFYRVRNFFQMSF